MKNFQGKSRDIENPYAVFKAGTWEWRVLKRYQNRDAEIANPYARWLCAVQSPHTYGGWDMGDVYVREIPGATPGMALGGEDGVDKLVVMDLAAKVAELVNAGE